MIIQILFSEYRASNNSHIYGTNKGNDYFGYFIFFHASI